MTESKHVTIVILNDGETYTDIDGCTIAVVPRTQYDQVIAAGGDAKDFSPIVEIGLSHFATLSEE